jgi:hypothetical protein
MRPNDKLLLRASPTDGARHSIARPSAASSVRPRAGETGHVGNGARLAEVPAKQDRSLPTGLIADVRIAKTTLPARVSASDVRFRSPPRCT